MDSTSHTAGLEPRGSVVRSVLLFWAGYVAITLAAGFGTSLAIGSMVWQHTAWGFLSSLGLLAFARSRMRNEAQSRPKLSSVTRSSTLKRFTFGLLIGMASFGVHISIMWTVAGPFHFEIVPEVGALPILIYFLRFLSTSCMEEIGFRGYPLRRLAARMGPLPAVGITSVVFGLSHFLYGWDAQTIAIGVIPCGMLWGMSAIATGGVAVPIGLHAAWNFTSWSAGGRAETGPLSMVADDAALERMQAVGTVSYLATFGVLTAAFWFVHRRSVHRSGTAR